MGMTDLQFKSYLKQWMRNIKTAMSKENKEEIIAELEEMLKDLEEDLKG